LCSRAVDSSSPTTSCGTPADPQPSSVKAARGSYKTHRLTRLELLNCGMGSSSLNADVNALERLQTVRDRNSVLRLEIQIMHRAGKLFRGFQFALDDCLVDDHFRRDVGEFAFLPSLYLLSHRVAVPLHPPNPHQHSLYARDLLPL